MRTQTNASNEAVEGLARTLLRNNRLTTLRLLDSLEKPVPIDTLSDLLTEELANGERPTAVDERRQRLQLIHGDVPALERHGMTEFDRSDGTVSRTRRLGNVAELCHQGERYLSAAERVVTDGRA